MWVKISTIRTSELFLSIILTNMKYANCLWEFKEIKGNLFFTPDFLSHIQDQQSFRLIQEIQAADKWKKQKRKTLKDSLLMGMQHGIVTMENSLSVSDKCKHGLNCKSQQQRSYIYIKD